MYDKLLHIYDCACTLGRHTCGPYSGPNVVPCTRSLLPGNKLGGGTSLTGWRGGFVEGNRVTAFAWHSFLCCTSAYPHRSFCPCSDSSPGAILLPWRCSRPDKTTPTLWMLYDKVIHWQFQGLISGLNPMSAGDSLSAIPLPGLLSSCPAPTAWLTIRLVSPRLSVFPYDAAGC